MPVTVFENNLQRILDMLWDAGDDGLEIRETTPLLGGLRLRDANALINEGLAEWVVEGIRIRATYKTQKAEAIANP